jgi:hypothetical protein
MNLLYLVEEAAMTKIMQYVSQPAGRDRVIKGLGRFSVVGAAIVSTILLVAAFLR